MSPEKRPPGWLFLTPVVAQLVIAAAGAACFYAWQLDPGRLLSLAAVVGAAASLGILVQERRSGSETTLRKHDILSCLAWYLLIGVGGAFAVFGFLRTPRSLPAGLSQALPSPIFLSAGAFGIHVVRRVVSFAAPHGASDAARCLALWLINIFWSAVLAAIGLILLAIQLYQVAFWATQILAYWILLLTVEIVIRVLALAVKRDPSFLAVYPTNALFETVYLRQSPLSKLAQAVHEEYGIDIASSRFRPVFLRGVPAVLGLLVLALWMLSAFVVIQPHELGRRAHAQRSQGTADGGESLTNHKTDNQLECRDWCRVQRIHALTAGGRPCEPGGRRGLAQHRLDVCVSE